MAKKYFIEISEEMYGAVATGRVYCPVASEFVLKKMYKHFCKMYRYMDSFNVGAYIENEDGTVEDLSMYWCYQEMEHLQGAGVIPFC